MYMYTVARSGIFLDGINPAADKDSQNHSLSTNIVVCSHEAPELSSPKFSNDLLALKVNISPKYSVASVGMPISTMRSPSGVGGLVGFNLGVPIRFPARCRRRFLLSSATTNDHATEFFGIAVTCAVANRQQPHPNEIHGIEEKKKTPYV